MCAFWLKTPIRRSLSATNSKPLADLEHIFYRHVAQTSAHPLGLVVERAYGPFIELSDGRKVIDLISGIAVSSIGHCHPRVVDAVKDQVDRHLHVMVYGECILQPQVALAALLTKHLPESLDVVYFCNSGTEATEGALKLAKKATGRSRMVAFEDSYHGDTHGSLSVTGREVYRKPFMPLLPGVTFLPFNEDVALENIDDTVACVIIEPIQGEGGVRVPEISWMKALRNRCSEAGALLIFDEIQTGMGRTGTLFAFEHFGVKPDVLCLAKAFGGGMPLGAFVSSAETMSALQDNPPLSHVTTFGGNPVSCAAGHAALQVIVKERLAERATEIGGRLRSILNHEHIREIRGMGAMLGMELKNADITRQVVESCLERGVLLGWTLHSDTLVRIAPPLNIPWDVLDDAGHIVLETLEEVA